MKLRKFRVVADSCPLKKKDCNKCRYNDGFDFSSKTYCHYVDKDNKDWRWIWNYGIDRSLISPDYAHNFICDHILGIDSGHTQPTLFNF